MSEFAAHVVVRRPEGWPGKDRQNPDQWEVWVDGVDLARKITADSLKIEFLEDASEVRVSMTLAVDVLDLDLPDAMVGASLRLTR